MRGPRFEETRRERWQRNSLHPDYGQQEMPFCFRSKFFFFPRVYVEPPQYNVARNHRKAPFFFSSSAPQPTDGFYAIHPGPHIWWRHDRQQFLKYSMLNSTVTERKVYLLSTMRIGSIKYEELYQQYMALT